MNTIDLFSGVGGNAYAFKSFATPALYCEIEPNAQAILRSAMRKGLVATAPIHSDVRTIMKSADYARAKKKRPLFVSGSWPCQGNSSVGKQLGMDDPRSGLLRQLCDIILDAEADVFFCENVPLVIKNGSLAYLLSRLNKKYCGNYGIYSAAAIGFPHERRRFFVVGWKSGFDVKSLPFENFERLRLDGHEPPRCLRAQAPNIDARWHALGNAVVPACSYYAFMSLIGRLDKAPAASGARNTRSNHPLLTPPAAWNGRFVFDPALYTPPAGTQPNPMLKQELLVKTPQTRQYWPTPRASCVAKCNFLTMRNIRDLATSIRFERNTPTVFRKSCFVNPEFLEWLMGFPAGYTEMTGKAQKTPRYSAPSCKIVKRAPKTRLQSFAAATAAAASLRNRRFRGRRGLRVL